MQQIVLEPTHVHGNTLDLICSSDANLINSVTVTKPGISDHYIITATLNVEDTCQPGLSTKRIVKEYSKVDIAGFQDDMHPVQLKLEEMNDIDAMWSLFTTELQASIDRQVPTKLVEITHTNRPVWFNKRANKLVQRQRRTYNKYKHTQDPFYHRKYKDERRESKSELKAIKNNYLLERICIPL